MAFVPLVPQTLNITCQKTSAASFNSAPVLGPTGSAISGSAWVSLLAQLVPASPNPTGAPLSFGTVTFSALGVLTLQQNDTDFATIEPGTAKLVITGKPTSGDIIQTLATGVATINNP
jgi:hypothetical protein